MDDISAESVAAEIVMLRETTEKAVLVLEGKGERKIIPSFVLPDQCVLVYSHGKSNALGAMAIVSAHGADGVIAVVDSDFDRFLALDVASDNVVVTEHHDFESLMFFSPAFEKVITEMAQPEKIAAFVGDLRKPIIDVACQLGKLRLRSIEAGLNLRFKDLKFKFLGIKLQMSVPQMVVEALNHSQMQQVEPNPIVDYILGKQLTADQRNDICCGHDICVVFGRALQSVWATLDAGKVSGADMESRLRLAYSYADFQQSQVYQRIKDWEGTNQPFRCLQ